MYTYKGVSYTEEEIKEAARQSGITVKEYLDRLKKVDPKPEDKQGRCSGCRCGVTTNASTRYGISIGRYFFGFTRF